MQDVEKLWLVEPQGESGDEIGGPQLSAEVVESVGETGVQVLDTEKKTPDGPKETDAFGGGMGDLMQEAAHQYRSPRRGDILEGIVASVDKEGILVDIGTKTEGIITAYELQRLDPEALANIHVGDEISVYVVQPEGQEGHVGLSLSRARSEQGWSTVQKHFEDGQIIEAEVVDFNKGGIIVNIAGIRGFVPMSQVVGLRQNGSALQDAESKLSSLVGESITLKVLEVNRRRNRLILSERLAVQERRQARKEQLLAEIEEGQIRRGRVTSLCEFGAFVDLGGADGLIHISELSWASVSHPSDVLNVGDEVDVYVISVDRDKKKIALSLRRVQPEPWATATEKYQPGDMVNATITRLANFWAFARLEDGIEGLVHISELSDGRIAHPKNVVKEGDNVVLRILRIDPEHRRMGLSLRQAPQDPPRQTAQDNTAGDA